MIAFDFGSKNIKIAIGSNKDKHLCLEYYEIIPCPKDAVVDGKIYEKSKISEILKQFVKRNKIKKQKIMLSISSGETILRTFNLPKMEERELKGAVKFELEHLLPESIDSYVIDFNVLEEYQREIEDGEKISMIKVQIAALPKSIVVDYLTNFKKAGLKIDIIDIQSNGIARLFGREEKYNNSFKGQEILNKNIAVIDLGNQKTTITIVESGKVFLSRVIYKGGRDITDIIARTLKGDMEEAEKWKISHNFLTEDSHVEIYSALRYYLEDFMMEFRNIIDYFVSRGIEKRLDGIYLIGGGAKAQGICQYFKNYTNIDTKLRNCDENIYVKTNKKIFHEDFLYLCDIIGILSRRE